MENDKGLPQEEAAESSFDRHNDTELAAALGIELPESETDGSADASPETAEADEPEVMLPAPEAGTGDEEEVEEDEAPESEGDEEAEDDSDDAEPESEGKDEKPKRELATPFQMFDENGELEIPEDVTISYKANGKVHENVPIDKVVQLAQMGHYNHEREQSLKARESEATAAKAEAAQLKAYMQNVEKQVIRMMEDVDFYDAAVDAYKKENSPEVKLTRLQQERDQMVQQQQIERETQYVHGYVSQRIAPALENMLKSNPHVTEYEVLGKYSELTTPLLVQGRLPVDRLATVEQLIERDLGHWAQSLNVSRADAEAERNREKVKERERSTKTKRQVARAAKPRGIAVPDKPKAKTIETADDFLDSLDEYVK